MLVCMLPTGQPGQKVCSSVKTAKAHLRLHPWHDDHGLGLMETNPQGRFITTNVNYAGTISPILEWLGDDAGSFVGTEGELNDGLIQFKGYVNIETAKARFPQRIGRWFCGLRR